MADPSVDGSAPTAGTNAGESPAGGTTTDGTNVVTGADGRNESSTGGVTSSGGPSAERNVEVGVPDGVRRIPGSMPSRSFLALISATESFLGRTIGAASSNVVAWIPFIATFI